MIYSLVMGIRQRYRFIRSLAQLCEWQGLLIQVKEQEIQQLQLASLASQQAYRDLAVAFRIAVEQPEVDIRDDLDALIRDLSDQLCVLEEHVA